MNRFHNKYHRHNHHTLPFPGEPDSAHDPIASPDDPFRGDFHVDGTLSAVGGQFKDLTVTNNFTVSGNTTFYGRLTVVAPVTHVLEHLTISPVLTTTDFYFKIDSNFNLYPLMEVYLNSNPIFVISSAGNVGIHTINPVVELDVNGDARVLDLTANNIHANTNISIAGEFTIDKGLTALSGGRIGYLDIGFVDGAHTYLKTVSGNYDLQLKSGDNLNLIMHPDNTNRFPGKVGIKMEPKEDLTINGQMSFRKNGFVLFDNSYFDTLRIITHREDVVGNNIDDTQHLFSFTEDGKYIISDTPHDYSYMVCGRPFATHRSNVIDNTDAGLLLSLTNITSTSNASGPWIDLYRANGDLNRQTAIKDTENLGGVRVWGYNEVTCFDNKSASIEFNAANDFTDQFQGASTSFYTVCAADPTHTPFERVQIRDDGNVGINTISSPALSPGFKFTVFDYPETTEPAMVVTAGISASPMAQIIGGAGVLEQVGLRLTDLGVSTTNDVSGANINHIEYTHGSNVMPIARVSTRSRGINASQGGSLFFSTTFDTATPINPFERMRLNHFGDLGVGIAEPTSRVHILDDDKFDTRGAGTLRDVVTIATANDTNGILLSSTDIQSRIYNRNTTTGTNRSSALHITTSTSGAQINFGVSDEQFAVIMTSASNVGIGINEILDTVTATLPPALSGLNTFRLGVSGNIILFNTTSATGTTGAGAMLQFNRELAINTDPIWIGRHNVAVGTDDVSELRVNIGDGICFGNVPRVTTITLSDLTGTIAAGTYSSTGTYIDSGATGRFIALSATGNILVTNFTNHTITTTGGAVFAGSAGITSPAGTTLATARFNNPAGIGINSAGTIYIADSGSHTIRRILGNAVTTFAGLSGVTGTTNATGTAARFNTPTGVCIDTYDNIYVSDTRNHTIRRITPTGRVTVFAGAAGVTGTANNKGTLARFNSPAGMSIDSSNNIYVADSGNHTIRKISSAGVVTTIVGTAGTAGATTGTMPGALLSTPTHVAVNPDGTELTILDGNGTRMRRVSIISTTKSVSYVNEDIFSIGNYPRAGADLSNLWERWIDVGACATTIYNNLTVAGDASVAGDVLIDGKLTVTNINSVSAEPLNVEGDLYVRGNIYATQDITAFWDDVGAGYIWPSGILSDGRVKLDVNNITSSLTKVMSINGVYFTWDEEKQNKHKGKDIGVIAQDVESVLPEIVHENSDGYKEVQYHKIIPLLIECIKDLKREIDELKSR